MQKTWVTRLLYAALLVGAISLIRSTAGQGTDLLVFYRAGEALNAGRSFYELQAGGMVFKYPPWIAPFFAPLAWVGFEAAKWIWGVLCAFCLAGVFRILQIRHQVSPSVWMPLAIGYWGLWVVHFLDGQVMIPILFAGLLAPGAFFAILSTAKVFTVFPVLVNAKEYLNRKTLIVGTVIVFGLTTVSAARSFNFDFIQMTHQWREAATSGSTSLNPGQTRGPKNQSITSWICRNTGVPAEDTQTEIMISLTLYCVALLVLWLLTQGFIQSDRFFIALALTPVFHPLPWHHLYVWTFPLAALTLQRWKEMPTKTGHVTLGVFGAVFLLLFSSERAFGLIEALKPLGYFLEWNVGRAWGALLLVCVSIGLLKPRDVLASLTK